MNSELNRLDLSCALSCNPKSLQTDTTSSLAIDRSSESNAQRNILGPLESENRVEEYSQGSETDCTQS